MHESRTVDLLFPPTRMPETHRLRFGLHDYCLQANATLCCEASLGLKEKSASQTETPVRWSDHQPIDGSTPTIPACDHGSDD